MREFDVVVIGAGVAGTTAALCAARLGRRVAVVETLGPGGQIINAAHIENMPGFPQGISGVELGPLLHEQAEGAGAEFVLDTVEALAVDGATRIVHCAGDELRAPAVIVATGSTLRKLGVPGEDTLAGRGVSQCASCDGPFFRGRRVAVAGGGDSALDEALVLTEFAERVLVLHRGKALEAQQTFVERVAADAKIEVLLEAAIDEVLGEGAVSGVRFTRNGAAHVEEVAALFVFVGLRPNVAFLGGLVEQDAAGHIETDLLMQTSLTGVFAAGDVRKHSVALLAASAGDGATAAVAAHRYLQGAGL